MNSVIENNHSNNRLRTFNQIAHDMKIRKEERENIEKERNLAKRQLESLPDEYLRNAIAASQVRIQKNEKDQRLKDETRRIRLQHEKRVLDKFYLELARRERDRMIPFLLAPNIVGLNNR